MLFIVEIKFCFGSDSMSLRINNLLLFCSAYICSSINQSKPHILLIPLFCSLVADPLCIIELDASCVITRRFRIVYSSIVAFGSSVAVDVDVSATIPTEAFILDTVNFSGGGTYLGGLDETSNDSLFVNCVGIINSSVNSQMYMHGNAIATTVSSSSTFYKSAGVTTASADNQKYTETDNRLTNNATIERKYLISCSLSFNSGNNNVCEFGFYDSKLAAVRTPSRTKATANAAGRAESVSFNCVVQHSSGDYIEIHCANNTGTNNITVTDMNVVITEII